MIQLLHNVNLGTLKTLENPYLLSSVWVDFFIQSNFSLNWNYCKN